MAFEMLCCKPAFSAESLAALHVRILRCSHAPFPDFVSARAKSFVRSLLMIQVDDRPTAAEATMRLRGNAFAPPLRRGNSKSSDAGGSSVGGSQNGSRNASTHGSQTNMQIHVNNSPAAAAIAEDLRDDAMIVSE